MKGPTFGFNVAIGGVTVDRDFRKVENAVQFVAVTFAGVSFEGYAGDTIVGGTHKAGEPIDDSLDLYGLAGTPENPGSITIRRVQKVSKADSRQAVQMPPVAIAETPKRVRKAS